MSLGRAAALSRATGPRFLEAVARSGIDFDAEQRAAIAALGGEVRHGHYLWGDVGRGKSLIGGLYFDAAPAERKRRFHFHDFFRDLQAQIVLERTPIEISLERLFDGARVVMFDEFHVHTVADAVYLTTTLRAILDLDVLLLATSNYPPCRLMPDPLHHERFAPAIEIIRREFSVVHLGDGVDYRSGGEAKSVTTGFASGSWSVDETRGSADGSARPTSEVEGLGVDVSAGWFTVRALSADDGTAVFTFAELCKQPLGVVQYLALAEGLSSMTIVGVPDLATVHRDPLLRFANLIDVFCDRDRELHIESAAGPERMARAQVPPRDAERTLSRLSMLRER